MTTRKSTKVNETEEIKEILSLISREMSSGFVAVAARLDDIENRNERDESLEKRIDVLEQNVLTATTKIESIIRVINDITQPVEEEPTVMEPQPQTTIINQEEIEIEPEEPEEPEEMEEPKEINEVEPTVTTQDEEYDEEDDEEDESELAGEVLMPKPTIAEDEKLALQKSVEAAEAKIKDKYQAEEYLKAQAVLDKYGPLKR